MAASSAPASAPAPTSSRPSSAWTRAKALFDLAEEAKAHLLEFAAVNGIDIDFMPGQLVGRAQAALRRRTTASMPTTCATRFGYPHIAFMDAAETAERLGSTHYFGGMRDTGTGHIHPLKLVDRHGAGGGRGRRAAVREHQGDRHHVATAAR